MMKDSTKRKFDVVMVWSIDRLGRSLQHLMEILNDLKSKNIDLYMVRWSHLFGQFGGLVKVYSGF